MSSLLLPRGRFWGQCATRCYTHTQQGDTSTYMARTFHYMRGNVSAVRVAVSNFRVATGAGGAESGVGTTTVSGSIEYPSGTFYQLTWGGSTSTTVAALTHKMSDVRPVPIPDGAVFWIRLRYANTVGIPYGQNSDGPHKYPSGGDALQATGTDLTMSGSVTDSFSTLQIWPAAIIGYTDVPSIAIVGDSRNSGLGDLTADATGDQGDIARALGPTYGYQDLAIQGSYLIDFANSSSARRALARHCTHVIECGGINDIVFNAQSDATARTRVLNNAALFPGKPFVLATMSPVTTGAWTNPAGSDQTVTAQEGARTSHNDWRRTDPLGHGYLEIADFHESSRNSGKWLAPGYTSDGIHASTTGAQAIAIHRRFARSANGSMSRYIQTL